MPHTISVYHQCNKQHQRIYVSSDNQIVMRIDVTGKSKYEREKIRAQLQRQFNRPQPMSGQYILNVTFNNQGA